MWIHPSHLSPHEPKEPKEPELRGFGGSWGFSAQLSGGEICFQEKLHHHQATSHHFCIEKSCSKPKGFQALRKQEKNNSPSENRRPLLKDSKEPPNPDSEALRRIKLIETWSSKKNHSLMVQTIDLIHPWWNKACPCFRSMKRPLPKIQQKNHF